MRFNQQPDIEVPQFLVDLGFRDESYQHDSCGRMHYAMTDDPEIDYIVVWVESPDPAQREYRFNARYMVQVCIDDDDFSDGATFVLYSENEDEVKPIVAEIKQVFADGREAALDAWVRTHEVRLPPE